MPQPAAARSWSFTSPDPLRPRRCRSSRARRGRFPAASRTLPLEADVVGSFLTAETSRLPVDLLQANGGGELQAPLIGAGNAVDDPVERPLLFDPGERLFEQVPVQIVRKL